MLFARLGASVRRNLPVIMLSKGQIEIGKTLQMEVTMIRLVAVAIVLAVATSAQAMSPAPLHQPDGMTTHARQARQLPPCD